MSLFDVIKYPISTPPTTEELEALPHELFQKWLESACPGVDVSGVTPTALNRLLLLVHDGRELSQNFLKNI